MTTESPRAHPQKLPFPDSTAGICNLAYIREKKKLCHNFGKAVDLLLTVCMIVQEVAHMLFHIEGINNLQSNYRWSHIQTDTHRK